MACLQPIRALSHSSGRKKILSGRYSDTDLEHSNLIDLPCKKCEGCRGGKVRDWAVRGYHEMLMNTRPTRHGPAINGCFVTLTYDRAHLPQDGCVRLDEVQSFMRRLRRQGSRSDPNLPRRGRIRFLACGEYGPKTLRPHYHLALYGVDFHEDRERFYDPQRPDQVDYVSKSLDDAWEKKGRATLSNLSFATVAYTAGYVLKKIKDESEYGNGGKKFELDSNDSLLREFNTVSTKHGLGHDWFQKYWSDVYPKDSVEVEGKTFRPPNYYDTLLKKRDPALHAQVVATRQEFVRLRGPSSDYDLTARRANHASRLAMHQRRESI